MAVIRQEATAESENTLKLLSVQEALVEISAASSLRTVNIQLFDSLITLLNS